MAPQVQEDSSQAAESEKEGMYIYCIIGTDEKKSFGPIGIGEKKDEVYCLCHEGIAVVISRSPVTKYPITRKNTIAHQKVLEEVMKNHTVLPVRFCTIAEGKNGLTPEGRIKRQVLEERHNEFKELLAFMDGKIELGVKAIWTNMDDVFREVVEDNPAIKSLKGKILSKGAIKRTHGERVRLGEMVKNALEEKRERLKNDLLRLLKDLSVDSRTNKTFGDNMIVNGAFLVKEATVERFDHCLDQLDEHYKHTIKYKYVGPVPPCNFVEIVVHWE